MTNSDVSQRAQAAVQLVEALVRLASPYVLVDEIAEGSTADFSCQRIRAALTQYMEMFGADTAASTGLMSKLSRLLELTEKFTLPVPLEGVEVAADVLSCLGIPAPTDGWQEWRPKNEG